MMTNEEITQLLDLHAALLVAGDPAAAELATSAGPEAATLMAVATRTHAALPLVRPDPAFRAALGRGLARASERRGAWWHPTLRRPRLPLPRLAAHRRATVVTSGAAVAAFGLAVAWLAERSTRTAVG
jgi:hypothetical protein